MDAFYEAVETLSNPSLKAMAIGGMSMLSTTNYEVQSAFFYCFSCLEMLTIQNYLCCTVTSAEDIVFILQVFYEPKQWDFLIDQFKQEFCKLYGMTLEPLLNIYHQAGLSALKTPFCYEDDCTKEDPLSQENFRKLANPLPFSKQHHSKLVCYITKELMDTVNPPLVLPNGYVYSEKALLEMANNNDGRITCPRTRLVCTREQLVKAFIS